MPQCAFRNCRNNYRKCKLADGISYFRFPNNPHRAAKWISIVATERSEEFYKPTKNSVICSEHFDSNDIMGNTERRRLNKSAVPKLKIQSIPEEQTVTSKSRTCYKAQKGEPQDTTVRKFDSSEQTSYDDQDDIPPSSLSNSPSENDSLTELDDVEYLQNKLTKCRKIIQQKSTIIKKLEDQNNRLKNTIDFLLNHYENNSIGKHFLQNFD